MTRPTSFQGRTISVGEESLLLRSARVATRPVGLRHQPNSATTRVDNLDLYIGA
jgi:hypothetical protein